MWEVKRAQKQQSKKTDSTKRSKWGKSGPDKFEEEIVKWREMSYAHAFARLDYDDVANIPELYAVRMTWGKTVVEWIGCSDQSSSDLSPAQVTLRTLCYLNDRYALDALSPPSYAGLLWCMGWSDKPNGNADWRISQKQASRYKMSAEQFRLAEQKLLSNVPTGVVGGGSAVTTSSGIKRQPSLLDMMRAQPNTSSSDTTQTQTKPKSNNSGAKRKRSVLDLMKSHASSTKSSDT